MELKLSPVVDSLKESATLAINQTALALRKEGKTVYHFGFGQSPFPVPPRLQNALKEATEHKEYLPTRGLPELGAKFAEYYNCKYGTDLVEEHVFVGPGSKELIFQVLYLLDGPFIVPAPSWVSYGPQAYLVEKRVHHIYTEKNDDYKITASELEEACQGLKEFDQKILILNSPNNPTGTVYNEEESKEIVEVCRRHNVILISDEIYGLVDFTGHKFCSFAKFYPEGTIVSTGLSKGFSAGGYRIGMMGMPKEFGALVTALKTMISETFSAVSSPTQYAALAAYSDCNHQDQFIQNCTDIHNLINNYVYKRLIEMGIGCVQPEGAFYLFPDFEALKEPLTKKGIRTSVELCSYLLEKHYIATLPGSHFYMKDDYLCARMAPVDYDGRAALDALDNGAVLNDDFVRTYAKSVAEGCDAMERFVQELS